MPNTDSFLKSLFPFLAKLLIAVIIVYGVSMIFGPIPFKVNNFSSGASDVFSTTGEGKATIKPDIAVVNLGVEAEGVTVKEAQDRINKVSEKVTSELKKLGIKEEDIQTENYSIYPQYDYNKIITPLKAETSARPISVNSSGSEASVEAQSLDYNSQRITGYHASTSLKVKVRATEKVNEVIDIGTASGANQIGGISFDVEDRSIAENEARVKAVENAKKKAEESAKAVGLKLGKVVNYYESFDGGSYYGYGRGDVELDVKSIPPNIQPGSMEVVVSATVTYQIK